MRPVIAGHPDRFQHDRHFGARAIFVVLVIVVFGVLAARMLAGEDDWICKNGQWIMHGHPDGVAPTVPCPNE